MTSITTRAGKGSPLTNAEVDANFTNLNEGKLENVAPGASGNVLTSNGTAWTSALVPAGGLTYVYKTANYTAADKEGVIADTTGGSFTVTLPATPIVGVQVVIADGGEFGANNLMVARNGSTISNLSEDLVIDISGVSVQFLYDGTTWEVFAQAGAASSFGKTLDGGFSASIYLTSQFVDGGNS